jgi:transcriptional regulator GlxA family with amidase domain
VTSGIDLALALIRAGYRKEGRNQGGAHAGRLSEARGRTVTIQRAARRTGETESYGSGELEQWIAEHLKSDLRVEALAEQVHMSPRNFIRLYAKTRGHTPAKSVEAIRLDAARRRLEETADRITAIAEDCGFSDEEQMRTPFIRALGVPRCEYRKRFGLAEG